MPHVVAAAPGDDIKIGDFSVKFVGVKPVAGPNYTAIEGTLVATTSSGSSFTMKPEARTFPGLMGTAPTETNEAALLTRPGGQLYAVLGQPVTGDRPGKQRSLVRLGRRSAHQAGEGARFGTHGKAAAR